MITISIINTKDINLLDNIQSIGYWCLSTGGSWPMCKKFGIGVRLNMRGRGMVRYPSYLSCISVLANISLFLLLLAGLFFSIPSSLAEDLLHRGKFTDIEVDERAGVYRIEADIIIKAPTDSVRKVLSDYDHVERLNASILESEVISRNNDGSVTVRTIVKGCAAYYCHEFKRVDVIRTLPSGDIQAELVPESSQFISGTTQWSINVEGEDTRIIYFTQVEPDFYIPPVVGKFLIKKAIKEEFQTCFANLEVNANILAQKESQPDPDLVDTLDKEIPASVTRKKKNVSVDTFKSH